MTETTATAEPAQRLVKPYVGRFAPSPTGPLHFGSLLAAMASYLEARRHNGRWLLRIEDIDPPRQQDGAIDAILKILDAYGFEWDGDVIYQSNSADHHAKALARLNDLGLTYPCGCSRRDLSGARSGPLGPIYPGTCRDGTHATETAVRVRTNCEATTFTDRLQGIQQQNLATESGDFIVRRRDGLIAYHLAVVVDDHLQGITDIVRGLDLIDSTPRQIYLQQLLNFETPTYAHIPLAVHADDPASKLSKLTGAPALTENAISATLVQALNALQQTVPDELATAEPRDVWQWSYEHWELAQMRGLSRISVQKSHPA